MIQIGYNHRVKYTLTHSSGKPVLIVPPDNWDTDEKEYVRNKDYHGIFTRFSNNLTFRENGAEFINKIRNQYGINAEIRLIRWERHPQTDVWTRSYNGVLDLSEWSQDGHSVKCKFNSSGLETQLKARHNEKVELERTTSLDGVEIGELSTETIELEGRKVFLLSNLEARDDETVETRISTTGDYRMSHVAFPLEIVSQSDERVSNVYSIGTFGGNTNGGIPRVSDMFYLDNDRDKTLKISINSTFTIETRRIRRPKDNNQFIRVYLTKYNNNEDFDYVEDYLLYDDPEPLNGLERTVTINFSQDISLSEGESLCLHFSTGGTFGASTIGIGARGEYNHDFKNITGNLTIEEDSFFEKSSAKIIMAHEMGQRLSQIITGRSDAFVSDTLGRTDLGYQTDGHASLKGYAHGHWIRGFDALPNNEENKYKPFTTSFKDYFNDLSVTEAQGLDIERIGFREQIRIRDRKDFYAKTVGIRLPNQVGNVKRKTIKDKYYSALEFGFEKGWDNEEAMGLDETNAKTKWVTPIIRISRTLSLVSKYVYASYAREFIRRKPISTHPTEDHTNDKEIFAFSLKRDGQSYKERYWQDDFAQEPTDIYSPETATNLKYSPLNLLLRNAWYFMGGLTKNLSDKIRFTSSEGNSRLTTQLIGGELRSENGDIDITDLDKPMFIPEEITFNHRVTFDIAQALEEEIVYNGKKTKKKYCEIEFINEKGELEHGYLMSNKPNGSGTWTLIKSYRP